MRHNPQSTTRQSFPRGVGGHGLLAQVVAHADFATLLALRSVSRALQALADAVLFAHVVVVPWGEFDASGGRLGGDAVVILCSLRTPLGAVLPCKPFTPVPILPPGVSAPTPQSWPRRLHHVKVLDVLLSTTYDTYAPVVAAARPRVLRRLRPSGIWHLPRGSYRPSLGTMGPRRKAPSQPLLSVVDVLLLGPSRSSTHLASLTLVHTPSKHVVNVLVPPSYRGAGFAVVGGDTGRAAGVLVFRPLAEGCALHAYASGSGGFGPDGSRQSVEDSWRKRLSGSSAHSFTGLAPPPAPTLFHSLAHTLLSGAYASLTLVGLHELPAPLLGLRRPLAPAAIHGRIVNLIREACHASAAAGFPPRTPTAELAVRLRLLSRAEYAAEVGPDVLGLETWGEMPTWWEPWPSAPSG